MSTVQWLITLVLILAPFAQGQTSTTLPKSTAPDFSQMSLDDLIEQLPAAGTEYRWNESTQSRDEDPASATMRRRLAAGAALTEAQWQRALLRTRAVILRPKWPVDQPLAICMRDPAWLDYSEIRLKPTSHPLKPALGGTLLWETCGNAAATRRQMQSYQELGRLPKGKHSIRFALEIEHGDDYPLNRGSGLKKGILFRGSMTTDVEVVDSLTDAMPPVAPGEINNAIAAGVSCEVHGYYKDGKNWTDTVFISLQTDVKAVPELASTAFSLRIELLRDGKPVESTERLTGSEGSFPTGLPGPWASWTPDALSADAVSNGRDLDRWSVRIRGLPDHALELWDCTQYWDGEVTIPLTSAVAAGQKRLDRPNTSHFK